MAYEQRPGDLSIFAETDKKNEKAPDWRGTMIVPDDAKPGDRLEVALWAKGGRGTMLAGSVKQPRQRESGDDGFRGAVPSGVARGGGGGDRQDSERGNTRTAAYDLSDDIPFVRHATISEA
jgi:hypothetical protein